MTFSDLPVPSFPVMVVIAVILSLLFGALRKGGLRPAYLPPGPERLSLRRKILRWILIILHWICGVWLLGWTIFLLSPHGRELGDLLWLFKPILFLSFFVPWLFFMCTRPMK